MKHEFERSMRAQVRDSRLFPEECTKYVQFRVPAAPDLLTISRRFRHDISCSWARPYHPGACRE